MNKVFVKWVMVGLFLAVAGCGNQAEKDAASMKEGVDAYAKNDFAIALDKFRPLADKGNVDAQERLGLIYAKGQGVEQNWVQADMWFSIAAASGKETAVNNKKVVEVHMPPEKVAEANVLAQDWLTKHKK